MPIRQRIIIPPRGDFLSRFQQGAAHPRYKSDECLLKELGRCALGCLALTGRLEKRTRSRRYCEVECSECKQIRWILVDNILAGKTSNCKCQRNRKYPVGSPAETLGRRYDAMVQRCERNSHVSSHHYKGRGIEVEFKSRQHFIEWALATWPSETFEGKDFDRRDNDGNYSPGNLQLTSRSANLRNRRPRVTFIHPIGL